MKWSGAVGAVNNTRHTVRASREGGGVVGSGEGL